MRAVKTALLVGPILTIINQTPAFVALLSGERLLPATMIRVALTFVVPFAVSFYSASMADRARRSER